MDKKSSRRAAKTQLRIASWGGNAAGRQPIQPHLRADHRPRAPVLAPPDREGEDGV